MEIARIAVIDEMKRQGVGHALMLALKAVSYTHLAVKHLPVQQEKQHILVDMIFMRQCF